MVAVEIQRSSTLVSRRETLVTLAALRGRLRQLTYAGIAEGRVRLLRWNQSISDDDVAIQRHRTLDCQDPTNRILNIILIMNQSSIHRSL